MEELQLSSVSTGNQVMVVPAGVYAAEFDIVSEGGTYREMVGSACGATERSLYEVVLPPSGRVQPLTHPGDAVYYVVSGTATVTGFNADESSELTPGAMVHVAGGSTYQLSSTDGARLVGGPSPVDPGLADGSSIGARSTGFARIDVYHRDEPGLMVPFISQDARLVVWLGRGHRTANMNYVVLEPGERNKEHVHRYSEDTIHIIEGRGTAEDLTHGIKLPVGPGDTVHIPPGTWHAVAADLGERVVSVGGPCPADLDMLRAVGVDVDSMIGSGDTSEAS
jgi:quercetin dioxygenase-like cupin family protein